MKLTESYLRKIVKEEIKTIMNESQLTTGQQINKMFQGVYDPSYANLQRAALLAMQGRLPEATGNLNSALKDVDISIKQKIIDGLKNIKPVTINGKVATSSQLDASKPHNDWIKNTFIPWAYNLMGKK